MEKGEWVKHMLFLYLQVPYDENITLGTREYGVQLNIITELRKVGEQKGRKLTQPTHKNKKRKSSSGQDLNICWNVYNIMIFPLDR